VPILTYHHVYADDDPSMSRPGADSARGVTTASRLRRHLELLRDGGWEIISHTALVDWLIDRSPLPERAAVVHFDNGWLDTCEVAKPLLDAFGATAMCFVITDLVEKTTQGSSSDGAGWSITTATEGAVGRADHPVMNWDQLRELLRAGWEIGAHTASHRRLPDVLAEEGEAGLLREIESSNALLTERLGAAPQHFAYPSGAWSEQVESLIASYYRSIRLWRNEAPTRATFTTPETPRTRLECQNIDIRISDEEVALMLELAAR